MRLNNQVLYSKFFSHEIVRKAEMSCNISPNCTLLLCKKTCQNNFKRLNSKNLTRHGYWPQRVVDKVNAAN